MYLSCLCHVYVGVYTCVFTCMYMYIDECSYRCRYSYPFIYIHTHTCIYIPEIGCVRCGCSSEWDEFNERRCWCSTCIGSGLHCVHMDGATPFLLTVEATVFVDASSSGPALPVENAHRKLYSPATAHTSDLCEDEVWEPGDSHLDAGCVRCGCSSEWDEYNERRCWCSTCIGSGLQCIYPNENPTAPCAAITSDSSSSGQNYPLSLTCSCGSASTRVQSEFQNLFDHDHLPGDSPEEASTEHRRCQWFSGAIDTDGQPRTVEGSMRDTRSGRVSSRRGVFDVGCLRCGCSSEWDEFGERRCWCTPCIGSSLNCVYSTGSSGPGNDPNQG
jgi:hypothetical protein